MANLARQPDFDRIAESHRVLAHEMSYASNIPAVAEGASILRAIQTMTENMNTKFDTINGRLDTLTGRLDTLDGRVDALSNQMRDGFERANLRMTTMDANTLARIANSLLVNSDHSLTPLRSLATGADIENFPATAQDLNSLSSADVSRILLALGATPSGLAASRKQKLRVLVGLRLNPA